MGALVSCISNLMYIGEKITLFATCTGLICCLMLTITMTLGMGIGLGYNYCFVDMKTRYKYIKGHYIYPGSPRWPYRLRSGNAPEESESEDDDAGEDSLRKPSYKIDGVPPYISANEIDPALIRELGYNNTFTDDEGIIYYHPTFPDLESYNGTANDTLSTVLNDGDITTVMTETNPGTYNTNNTSFTTDTSLTTSTIFTTNTSFSTPTSFSTTTTSFTTNTIFTTSTSITTNTTTSITTNFTNGTSTTTSPTETKTTNLTRGTTAVPNISSSRKVKKLVIPISGLELINLLSKLTAENKNYSLQVVTT